MKGSMPISAFGLALTAVALFAQTPAPSPAFEVASVRAATPATAEQIAARTSNVNLRIDADRVDITSFPLVSLITMAYRVKPNQLTGPDWMTSLKFDIQAKIPEGTTRDQVPEMMQALLAERFKLVVRRESKSTPVYALTVGKNGLKVKEAPPDAKTSLKPSVLPNDILRAEITGTFTNLATFLSPYLDPDRPILDMTGLTGMYSMVVDISREEARANTAGPVGSPYWAAIEQLGLKLESKNVPMDIIVVEHLEKTPTEN